MSDANQLVARNVRRYRQERGLSMGELARRSGLSKQTLSKVEQGIGNPTVETLTQLSSALDIQVRRLLTEWGTPVFVQRRDEGEWAGGTGWGERILDEIYGSGHVRTHVLRLDLGAEITDTSGDNPPGTLLHVYVISGRVETGPLTEPVTVDAEDFVRFPGDVPYRHACRSAHAVAHVVTTLPQLHQVERGLARE